MKNNKGREGLIVSFLALALTLTISNARASGGCGDSPNTSGLSNITEDEAIKTIRKNFNVEVKRSELQSMCGGIHFDVKEQDGTQLAWIEVDAPDHLGAALLRDVSELLKTPRAQLKALRASRKILLDDMDELEKEFGITFYDPSALPTETRFPNKTKQLLEAVCRYGGTRVGKITVNVSEYVPGRSEYPSETVYHKGELKETFLKDAQLLQSYREMVKNNGNCGSTDDRRVDEILEKLKAPDF